MEKLTAFVSQHLSEDTARLILNRDKWPGIDMDLAVNCIESRRKLRGKVKEWYNEPSLVFPAKLSAEQCSSSATAAYKASFAGRIAGKEGWRIVDLTGGLGVDSWFFSRKAGKVLYNEMQSGLCEAAAHNFRTLNAGNILISCNIAEKGRIAEIAEDFNPDIIYMDPARRGEGGKKVFLIEECTPDVLILKEEIFSICRHILIKLSPMADISMVCERLGEKCREVHVVTSGGECKELLIWMDREWNGEYTISAIELPASYPDIPEATFSFLPSEEKNAAAQPADGLLGSSANCMYLFEPGKALMKAGCFNLIGKRFGLKKAGLSTHYYITDSEKTASDLHSLGKVFNIKRIDTLDKRSLKAAGKDFPKAGVTARNIPMTSEMLRKKLGCNDGDEAHIFGLKSDTEGMLLIIGERIKKQQQI